MPPERKKRRTRVQLIAVAAVVGTTALTTFVGWAVTLVSDSTAEGLRSPVAVTVESDPTQTAAFSSEEQATVLPRTDLVAPDPGPGCQDLYTQSRAVGGVDAGMTRVHVFVRREAPGTAVISQAFVVIDEKLPTMPGSHLFCGLEGELENRKLQVDLDVAEPRIKYENDTGLPFGFTLGEGEVEVFAVRAVTTRSLVRWHLELEVVEGADKTTVRIDDAGKPFATSGTGGGFWSWDGNSWNGTGFGREVVVAPGNRFDAG